MADVEFRVLGIAEVLVGGRQLALEAPKQRALLAFLLVHANEPQPTDRIIDALWGEQPPAGGVKTLRYHVSKLRSALGNYADLIASRDSGYELVAPPESIDSRRFEALLEEAQATVVTDPTRASELSSRALDLWRGSPYADFPYEEFVQAEVRRLNELRLSAFELWIEADINSGYDSHLVPRLESLVTDHPLRERFWAQLMISLYRSGRQPDALRAYQRACDVFAELGTQPSAELADLEEQILLRDPLLLPDTPQVEGNLPATISGFVGRRDEIAAVRDLIRGERLVTVIGPGGVGKTRLAIEVSHGLVDEFAGGVWLVEYASVRDPDLAAPQIASALGVLGSAGERDVADHVADHLRGGETLLVLDNCEHLVEPIAEVLAMLLTRCPGLCVLATSRRPLGVGGEVAWRIAPLSIDVSGGSDDRPDALQLFFDRARAAQPSFVVTPESEVVATEVCSRLAGLPLAIELAASRMRMMSLDLLASRLDDAFGLLTDGPRDGMEHHGELRTLLDWSYELLESDAQRLFRFLSVFRGGFTLETAAVILGMFGGPRRNAVDLVADLVDMSVIASTPDDRFTMLDPIREHGVLLLGEHDETESARDMHAAVVREMFFDPEPVPSLFPAAKPDVAARFVAEIDNVRAAVAWMFETGDLSAALDIGEAVSGLLFESGYVRESHGLRKRLLAETDEASVRRAKVLRGVVYPTATLEGIDRAVPLVDELAATADALDDDTWRAISIERRGVLAALRGDFAAAFEHWEDAMDRLVEIDRDLALGPLGSMVQMANFVGNFPLARDLAERVVAENRVAGYGLAWFRMGIAFAAAADGDPETAEIALDLAENELAPGEGPLEGSREIRALISLARMDLDEAEQRAIALLDAARQTRSPMSLYMAILLVGLVRYQREDFVIARRYFAEGLADARRLELGPYKRWFLAPHAATFATTDAAECVALLAAVETANRADGWRPIAAVARVADQAAAVCEATLTPEELEQAQEHGAAMTIDEAIEIALGSLTAAHEALGST